MSAVELREHAFSLNILRCAGQLNAAQSTLDGITVVAAHSSQLLDSAYNARVEGVTTFKSSPQSLKYRTAGNEAYGRKEYMKSLQSYDDSISHAPVNSLELALAFANRSAVLREMGKLTECISDLQRALDCGYPENLKYKLLFREARCLRDLGQSKQAKDAFNSALAALKSSDLSAERKGNVKSVMMEEKNLKSRTLAETYKVFTPTKVPPLKYGPNQEVPCASSALEIRYGNELGRYMVASKNIKIGDVLIVEDPYVVKPPNSSQEDIHCCSHCQKICFSLLPCPNCTWAMFCSDKCMTDAGEQYHLIECPITSKFLLLDEEMYHYSALVIRCIAKVGLDKIQNYLNIPPVPSLVTNETNRTRGFNSEGIYDSTDFLTVFNLESHFSKFIVREKFPFCFNALLIAKCFNPTNYLNSHNFTALLLHLFLSCRFSAFGIKYPSFKIRSGKFIDLGIGAGVYPASSLIKHSCIPNAFPTMYGNKLVLRAVLPIAKGKEVTISQITSWAGADKSQRQTELKNKYKFDCECEACLNNWAHVNNLQLLIPWDLKQLFPNSDIDSKFLKFMQSCSKYGATLESLLRDKKSVVKFVDKASTEMAEIITLLWKNNNIDNLNFILMKNKLRDLFFTCGTTITNLP